MKRVKTIWYAWEQVPSLPLPETGVVIRDVMFHPVQWAGKRGWRDSFTVAVTYEYDDDESPTRLKTIVSPYEPLALEKLLELTIGHLPEADRRFVSTFWTNGRCAGPVDGKKRRYKREHAVYATYTYDHAASERILCQIVPILPWDPKLPRRAKDANSPIVHLRRSR